jgi:V/A-type H+/Na+-transporting ATPase subunit E
MAEEIKDLIEKINREGVQAAEEKAREIEGAANKKAAEIIAKATLEAKKIITGANEEAGRVEEKGKTLLSQAGRDMLLALRKEINSMLERVVVAEVRQALSAQALSGILAELIKGYGKHDGNIEVMLKKEDLDVLETHFLRKLKEGMSQEIVLRPLEEVSGGFAISFDSGKSRFDFTDKALAEYIGAYLKPKLNQILAGAAGKK